MKRSYRHWSRDEVVREIRRLATEQSLLHSGYIAREFPSLLYAARKYLGGWEQAISAAGLDYGQIRRKRRWNKKTVIARIQELKAAGAPLHVSAIERAGGGLVAAAVSYFGSWRKACEAAGLDYSQVRRQHQWSKREIVKEIRNCHKQGLELDTTMEVRQKYRTLHAAAVRYFGGWAQALRAARLGHLVHR